MSWGGPNTDWIIWLIKIMKKQENMYSRYFTSYLEHRPRNVLVNCWISRKGILVSIPIKLPRARFSFTSFVKYVGMSGKTSKTERPNQTFDPISSLLSLAFFKGLLSRKPSFTSLSHLKSRPISKPDLKNSVGIARKQVF